MSTQNYAWYKATLMPETAFASPLVGDMLFGQICATLAEQNAEKLNHLLQGYTQGKPFLIVSDAFPAGFLPKPRIPVAIAQAGLQTEKLNAKDRKLEKKKSWVPLGALTSTTPKLSAVWQAAQALPQGASHTRATQTHNSINRLTSTTDSDFTPYSQSAAWYAPGTTLEIYCIIDTSRFSQSELDATLKALGQWGFGKDATTGKGKFTLQSLEAWQPPVHNPALFASETALNYWTLAACAPQGLGFDAQSSFYLPVTRYPRHGGQAVHASPYKAPLLLADTAALFVENASRETVHNAPHQFIGQGLGGIENPISKAIPSAVHQGYAPVIALTA